MRYALRGGSITAHKERTEMNKANIWSRKFDEITGKLDNILKRLEVLEHAEKEKTRKKKETLTCSDENYECRGGAGPMLGR